MDHEAVGGGRASSPGPSCNQAKARAVELGVGRCKCFSDASRLSVAHEARSSAEMKSMERARVRRVLILEEGGTVARPGEAIRGLPGASDLSGHCWKAKLIKTGFFSNRDELLRCRQRVNGWLVF